MIELFEVQSTKEPKRRVPIMRAIYLPVICGKCGVTYIPDDNHGFGECIMCDGEPDSMLWHEYVLSLNGYMHTCHESKINKLSADLLKEYEKTLKYIEIMGSKINASDVMNSANEKAKEIVEDFEETEVWV